MNKFTTQNMLIHEENNKSLFDKYNDEYIKYPKKGTIGAFLGFIPGCILWLVLSYHNGNNLRLSIH